MSTIIPFLVDTSFDPQHVEAMGRAFDAAKRSLHDKGQPTIVLDIIAKRIIEIAKTGERDPDKMCNRALKALGFPSDP